MKYAPTGTSISAQSRVDRQAKAKQTQRNARPAEETGVAGRPLGFREKLSKRWRPQHRHDQ
jgi:hypothetical protein